MKSSYRRGGRYFALKIAATFPGNPARGLPAGNGMMLLSSAETGEPVAFLADAGHLTDVRTAAVSALVARELGRRDRVLGILGTGIQARLQAQHARRGPASSTRSGSGAAIRSAPRSAAAISQAALPHAEISVAASPADVAGARAPDRHRHRLAPPAAARRAICSPARTSPPSARTRPASRNSTPRSCAAPPCCWSIRAGSVRSWVNCSTPRSSGRARSRSASSAQAPTLTIPRGITVCDFTGLGVEDLYIAEYCYERGTVEDRTVRNGADAIDVGEPRRDGHERERRAPGHACANWRRWGSISTAILDMPLGYSQSNGTIALREELDAHLSGRHRSTRSKSPTAPPRPTTCSRSRCCAQGDEVAFEVPNYMQYGGVPQSLGAKINHFRLRIDQDWEPDWEEFERAVNPKTRLVYLSNPNNPSGSACSHAGRHAAHRASAASRWARTCWPTKSISARRSTARARPASGA